MAPNPFATVAYAMKQSMTNTIMNKGSDLGGSGFAGGGFSGGGGGGSGHHRHHNHSGNGDGGNGINRDVIFGNAAVGDGNGRQSFMTAVLAKSSGQHRMGIVVTLAFSIVAALIVIYTVISDAYRVKPGEVYSRAQKSSSIFKALHPAEVFPIILAITILIQAFVFIGEQSTGFENFSGTGFQVTSQVIWTVFFLVMLVVVAFSLETAFRALQKKRFQPRGKLTIPLCLGGVVLATLGLFVYAHVKMPILDIGPLSLAWWTSNWPMVGIFLAAIIAILHIVAGAIIIVQLLKTADVQMEERIAASRIVYTMGIDLITIALIVPFWIQLLLDKESIPLEASFVSDIGITLTGLLFATLHIISRANAERMAIRPKNMPASDKRIRLFGSSDLGGRSISGPVLEPKLSVRERGEAPPRPMPPQTGMSLPPQMGAPPRPPPPSQMDIPNEPPPDYLDPMNLPAAAPRDFTITPEQERPLPPQPAAALPEKQPIQFEVHPGTPIDEAYAGNNSPLEATHGRQPTYSSIISGYSTNSISRPAPLFAAREQGRMDSTFTSAEIEIGLRLSNAPSDMQDSDEPNTDKSLPTTPRTPEAPEASPEPPQSASPALAPANLGIGALGMGPKSGLKIAPSQPARTSPLAMVTKASTPTPTEKQNPFELAGSRKGSNNSLSPHTNLGLPINPSPRTRGQSPAPAPRALTPASEPSPAPAPAESPVQSPIVTQSRAPVESSIEVRTPARAESPAIYSPMPPSLRSPTEWPAGDQVDVHTPMEQHWPADMHTPVERHWPSGDQVNVHTPMEQHWKADVHTPVERHWPSGDQVDVQTPVEQRWA